ncbi:MAG: DUF861 domain-containing protein [Erysipelotrichaceae bacterium]|nr:DUF861 domain-containing protein [Erysipelotrichaceae bacterium]
MKIIRKNEAVIGANSDKCKTYDYPFSNFEIGFALSEISGRYPAEGFVMNQECTEIVYILEGQGKLVLSNETVEFKEGDSIIINKGEKYFWDAQYCKMSMSCSPKWSPEQHKTCE